MSNCWVIERQWYQGKVLRKETGRDMYDEASAKSRAKMLTECHGPRTAYVARPATTEEVKAAQEQPCE